MNERAVQRLRTETELRGALERGEFLLHYQPKADLATGEISGFEALLRWKHPDGRLVPPGDFISILEETGQIIPVGEWVVTTVCRQLREWQAAGLPMHPIAVNLSPRQFTQTNLDSVVGEILRSTGIRPDLLEFELTESMLMTDSEAAVRILGTLKASGIRLSVDDFGTGYSSLAYLKRFPLDALKIDRAFIRDVPTDTDGATIVLAIINLAHSLKLHVVAEGVETDAQLQFLRKHGCDEVQGYYFAYPQAAEACTQALRQGWRLPRPNTVHWLTRKA
jgi:EAL domain-containing protein (putative c-di-GMP-specific phosphodiesterase class I)